MKPIVSFRHPPVVETVLCVQFDRLAGLTNAHLGAFWEGMRCDWPQAVDAPWLPEQSEVFGEPRSWQPSMHLRFSQQQSTRVQMKNESGDRMIQIQNCRLDYNWLRQPEVVYPRYSTIQPEFLDALKSFLAFIERTGLGTPEPNQWEVTYVNHMPRGTVWEAPEDWPGVFNGLPGVAAVPERLRLQGLGGHWHYEIKEKLGRLHVEVGHGHLAPPDKKEVITMKLTARGPIEKSEDHAGSVERGLTLGHDIVVTSFRDLTSPKAHDSWNKET